jgi:hypothetical protein
VPCLLNTLLFSDAITGLAPAKVTTSSCVATPRERRPSSELAASKSKVDLILHDRPFGSQVTPIVSGR